MPPIAGGAATGESLTLKASDGTEFAAFHARAEDGGNVGIVILPDVRGLHAFYEDLALRFAEQGIHAVAFDYFGRTAGVGRRDDDFDFWPEVMKTKAETVAHDVAASVEHLRANGVEKVFTVGFCFGGRNSFNQAARGHGLSGVIGFYGGVAPRNEEDTDAPVNQVASYECPVLGLFGGADQMITAPEIDAFGKALDAAGVDNELKIYGGAPHSFFDRAFAEFATDCDDAWTRMLSFIKANS
jgi:carboxymethylenebutenolidase